MSLVQLRLELGRRLLKMPKNAGQEAMTMKKKSRGRFQPMLDSQKVVIFKMMKQNLV